VNGKTRGSENPGFTARRHTTKAEVTSTRQISLDPSGVRCVECRHGMFAGFPPSFDEESDPTRRRIPAFRKCDFGQRGDLHLASLGGHLLLSHGGFRRNRSRPSALLPSNRGRGSVRGIPSGMLFARTRRVFDLRGRETRMPLRSSRPKSGSLGRDPLGICRCSRIGSRCQLAGLSGGRPTSFLGFRDHLLVARRPTVFNGDRPLRAALPLVELTDTRFPDDCFVFDLSTNGKNDVTYHDDFGFDRDRCRFGRFPRPWQRDCERYIRRRVRFGLSLRAM